MRLYYEEEVGQMRTVALLAGLAGLDQKKHPPTSDRQWLEELLDEPAVGGEQPDPDSEAARQGQVDAEALFGGPADGPTP